MERLKKIGDVRSKVSADFTNNSRIGIGFEKLDRAVFDPNKAYDKVADIGVKWTRIQSGWARTEKEKGVYDFAWLDEIVDNLIKRGTQPWMVLCYGNPVYSEWAAKYFGAVGCPPISTQEEKEAWINYVSAVVSHYKGKIQYYEIWNEPDCNYSWKHPHGEEEPEPGPNPYEYAAFFNMSAEAVHKADSNAKTVACAIAHPYDFTYLNRVLSHVQVEHMDAVSFHAYTADDTLRPEYLKSFRRLLDSYKPGVELIQGETGAQSRSDGAGAMHGFSWTKEKQLKHLLRNLLHDLAHDVKFTSYFSTMDMIEALKGLVSDKKSYLDYGYFGVLSADFDDDGFSTGNYTPKPSYRALQVLTSIFAEGCVPCEATVRRIVLRSHRVKGNDCNDPTICMYTFEKENGSKGLVYWNAVPLLTQTYEGTVSFQIFGLDNDIKLVDLADGSIYELPDEMINNMGDGETQLVNLPITDTPKLITFGNFID